MKRVLIAVTLFAFAAGAYWVLKGSFPGSGAPARPDGEQVAKLDGLYLQAEELEARIRTLESQGKKYNTEQHALELVRESVETLRSEIRQNTEAKSQPASADMASPFSRLEKIKEIPRSAVLAFAGVLAVIILFSLISVLRRQLFGMKMKPKPFTQVIPAVRKAAPAPEALRPPPARRQEVPDEAPVPDRPIEQASPSKAARSYERLSPAGTQNEQIVDLYRQGLTIKEISNRLKVGLDQVALVVRLQPKE